MNTISPITPNYNHYKKSTSTNVQFEGKFGDEFVKEIINNVDVKPADLIKEMKGIFGIKTNKAEDILESFIRNIKQMYTNIRGLKSELKNLNDKIEVLTIEKDNAVITAERKVKENFQFIINAKNEEVLAKDNELKKMKAQLEKYQHVAKVKSVEELGRIMPDKAIELIDELVKNKIPSRKSIAEFLLTGKRQEEALKQIERNNMLMKAQTDGVTRIPEVSKKIDEMKGSGIYFSSDSYFTMYLIESALKGSPKGSYIKSKAIKDQIKENAMAILSPMANEKYYNTGKKALQQGLDKCLENVEKYHDELAKGMEKLKKRIGKDFKNIEFKPVEFSPEDSKLVITEENGVSYEQGYQWIANYGNSRLDW